MPTNWFVGNVNNLILSPLFSTSFEPLFWQSYDGVSQGWELWQPLEFHCHYWRGTSNILVSGITQHNQFCIWLNHGMITNAPHTSVVSTVPGSSCWEVGEGKLLCMRAVLSMLECTRLLAMVHGGSQPLLSSSCFPPSNHLAFVHFLYPSLFGLW
jgi:hypothetical protein